MNETNVISLRKTPRAKPKSDHEQMADGIRKLYRKLCAAIDAATSAGLHVEVFLDSGDVYGGNKVRSRDVKITKKL